MRNPTAYTGTTTLCDVDTSIHPNMSPTAQGAGQLIQQYPDNKLVPEAKQRLREVQEVLAEREFRVARFYASRESFAAAIARLRSLIDAYPLYRQADDALFLLGQN